MRDDREKKPLKLLVLSDEVVEKFYSAQVVEIFPDIELIISCGDLPYYYLEFILDMLNVPMFFVHGNHDPEEEISTHGNRKYPWGAENLDRKFIHHQGLIFMGLEGSIRYSKALHQYTQAEMWARVAGLVPRLLLNRMLYGRALDVFVSHSPAYQIGDAVDPAHQGFKAFRWLLEIFKPRYQFHGHVHIYDRKDCEPRQFMRTTIINSCTYQRVNIEQWEGGKRYE